MAAVRAGWRDLSIGETGSDITSLLQRAQISSLLLKVMQLVQSGKDPAHDVFPGKMGL